MSARDQILHAVRRSLNAHGADSARRKAVAHRLARHPAGTIPERGQVPHRDQVALFRAMAKEVQASVDVVESTDDVPAAIADYLRAQNLPQSLRRGGDERLAALPWDTQKTLEVTTGASAGDDLVALSRAFGGVAETGTLVLLSGPDNPSTLNFLPEVHIVMIEADDIAGDYEAVWNRLREHTKGGVLPRTVNMITGPSRSGDIEQTILLGAHGPKQLHIIVVGTNRPGGKGSRR